MRLLILTASLWALALAKPEMYKESEDFQYSRSSSDEGSKSGFYGAQRGNMGGNYEKAHNMDSMAQHHMSTLVRQIDGELGEGANTKTGSAFTAANSRGIYGSGNYDLSNLKGRNFGENRRYDDSQSQSSLYQNARYQGNSYATNNARYGSEKSLSSLQRSGYSSSNLASQYSKSDLESENKYNGASNYDSDTFGGSNQRYYSLANSQARGAYDQSNTNLDTYDLSNQNRLTSTTPVKIYIRPGERVALPVSAPTYTLYSSNLQDKKVADTTNVLSNSGSDISYKPTNNAKHYESAYRYHKKWEKHDTQPLVVVPTENPFPANSELYEDRELDQTGQRYQSELDSSNSHLSNVNGGYSAQQNYQSGVASANAQSMANSAYSRGYAANTKTASTSQSRYQAEAQNKAASTSSNTYSLDTQNSGASAANLNNLVEDINARPKSYHSSFSYHKAWERRGDPYVITPSGDISGQTSQKLIAASQNQGQFSSQQYGSHYNQKSHTNVDCDAICHQRRKRSYNINQYEQDQYNGDINFGQQSEDGWDLGQQTENKYENLEDLGQAPQNTWDNLGNLGQQTQNKWNNLQNLGQETQNNWDHLTDLGQQAQSKWNNQGDLGQQTENQRSQLENLGQETQNQFSNIEDLGQKTQGEWSKLEDLGQQTQNQWGKLEDMGQQTQTNWGEQQELSQADTGDLEDKKQTNTTDNNNIIIQQEKSISNVDSDKPANDKFLWDKINEMFEVPPKAENSDKILKNGESLLNRESKELFEIEKLPTVKPIELKDVPDKQKHENTPTNPLEIWQNQGSDLDQQSENQWSNLGQQSENQWSNLGQQSENQWSKLEDMGQQTHTSREKQQNFGQAHTGDLEDKTQTNTTDNNNIIINQQEERIPNVEINEPSKDKLSLDKLNQIFEMPPKTETSDRIFKNGESESLLNHEKLFEIEKLPTNKYSEPKDAPDMQKHKNTTTNHSEIWKNQDTDLDQHSEIQWGDLGQQSENQWSNLGQQSENQWSNLGQQSQNQWSDLGQQSENQWSDLGQQSENQWSDLGQQSENQWSNLGQQSENQWSDLGQQSENQWSNLGQQSENQWSNLGQQSQHQWSDLGQQSQHQWSDLGQQNEHQWSEFSQQTQNVWSNLDQQSHFTEGEQKYLEQDRRVPDSKYKTEIAHNEETQNVNEFLKYFNQENILSHHSPTNKQNQPETKDAENFHGNNKDFITGDNVSGEKHNVENIPHSVGNTASNLLNKTSEDLGATNSKTSTEVQKLNTDTENIGRGDIGADDDSYEFGAHIIDEQEKPNLIVYNLPGTTMKPINNDLRKPNSYILTPTDYKIPVREEFTSEKPKPVTLLSHKNYEQNTDQQQYEQQNLDLQQTQEGLSVLPALQDYKTVDRPSQIRSIQLGRSLESVPLEKNTHEHDLTVDKHNGFAEQENKHEVKNFESLPKKYLEIETPLEPPVEKPGFWSSVWNKTKNAKDSVVSWFKN